MHHRFSRRGFLRTTGQAAFALAAIGPTAASMRAVEPFERNGPPRFPLGLAAYSFREFFKAGKGGKSIDLFQFVDFCATQGCQGAELTSYYFPENVTEEFLLNLRRHCFLCGVEVSGTAVGNTFTLPKGERLSAEIASVKKWVDHASVLGAPHIRVFAGSVAKGFPVAEAKKNCIAALEECAEYAGKKGIFLGLENHGGIVAGPDALLEIVQAVKSRWVGINLDTGNFHTADPYADLARCAPYAVNVQIKTVLRGANDETARPADFKRLFQILRDANYQGYVVLEYEGDTDPWETIPGILRQMKALSA